MTPRAEQLAAGWHRAGAAVAAACRAAGREPQDVAIIVVTKTWPVSDLQVLYRLGVRDFGENRVAEAQSKAAALPDDVRWHMIGQVQTNKAGAVCRFADVVHSVDRPALVEALAARCADRPEPLEVLVQVALGAVREPSGDPGGTAAAPRAGCPPELAAELAGLIAARPGLRLRGVMGMPLRAADPGPAFEELAAVGRAIRRAHPGADWISAGMSHDFPDAVAAGATHVRLGTAVLGARTNVR